MARGSGARSLLRVPDAAALARVRLRRHLLARARHRRQHAGLQRRQRPLAAAAAHRPPRTRRLRPAKELRPVGELVSRLPGSARSERHVRRSRGLPDDAHGYRGEGGAHPRLGVPGDGQLLRGAGGSARPRTLLYSSGRPATGSGAILRAQSRLLAVALLSRSFRCRLDDQNQPYGVHRPRGRPARVRWDRAVLQAAGVGAVDDGGADRSQPLARAEAVVQPLVGRTIESGRLPSRGGGQPECHRRRSRPPVPGLGRRARLQTRQAWARWRCPSRADAGLHARRARARRAGVAHRLRESGEHAGRARRGPRQRDRRPAVDWREPRAHRSAAPRRDAAARHRGRQRGIPDRVRGFERTQPVAPSHRATGTARRPSRREGVPLHVCRDDVCGRDLRSGTSAPGFQRQHERGPQERGRHYRRAALGVPRFPGQRAGGVVCRAGRGLPAFAARPAAGAVDAARIPARRSLEGELRTPPRRLQRRSKRSVSATRSRFRASAAWRSKRGRTRTRCRSTSSSRARRCMSKGRPNGAA